MFVFTHMRTTRTQPYHFTNSEVLGPLIKTSLIQALCIEVLLPSHDSERSCIHVCTLGVLIVTVFMIFLLNIGIVPGQWAVMYTCMYVRGINCNCFYDFSIEHWYCSDGQVFSYCLFYFYGFISVFLLIIGLCIQIVSMTTNLFLYK